MTLKEYQTLVVSSEPKYLSRGEEALLGLMTLNAASGKLFDLYAKSLFEGAELAPEPFLDELGEVIRNVAILAHVVDKELGDVMRKSVEQLRNDTDEDSDAGDEKER